MFMCNGALSVGGGPILVCYGALSVAGRPIFVHYGALSTIGEPILVCYSVLSVAGGPTFGNGWWHAIIILGLWQWVAAGDHSRLLAAGGDHAIKGWHQCRS